jgi:hypothetical protein
LITYVFWSPTKTINLFRWLWLIDIKSVRNIRYDCFVLVFNQDILPSWIVNYEHSSTLLLYCPCSCCRSFLWKNVIFLSGSEYVHVFIVCLYMYWRWRFNYQEGRVGILLTDLPRHIIVSVPSQDQDFQRHIFWSPFSCSVSWGQRWLFVFCYWWKCWSSLFLLYFYNSTTNIKICSLNEWHGTNVVILCLLWTTSSTVSLYHDNYVSTSEWLLFDANSAIVQLWHGDNKLIFNEMIMRSALY